MSINVFIDGGEGTTGLRLLDRLQPRSDIKLLSIDSALRKDPVEKAKVANSADIVFLCLPDDAAREAVAGITNPGTRVVDASTAHRTAQDWAYGLPELSTLHRERVEEADRVSVPGCHAMGFASLAYPLVAGGIAGADYPFTCHSITGFSGGGKGVIAQYGDSGRADYYAYPRQYALTQQHKHLPEMQKISGLAHPPVFNPIICDFYAGMAVTLPLHTRLLNKYKSAAELHSYFADFYSGQRMISVAPFGSEAGVAGGMVDPCQLTGKDTALIYVCGGDERIIVTAVFDNLGKGASGAAIQCMNLMCGFDEAAGLSV